MEQIIHNINGEAYLMLEVQLTEYHRPEINKFIAEFNVIDQTISLPLKDALVRKLLIPFDDIERFQAGIKDIDSKVVNDIAKSRKIMFNQFGIGFLLLFAVLIYYAFFGDPSNSLK